MKKGFYVEIVNLLEKEIKTVKATSYEDAVSIARKHNRADAHEWAQFDEGFGNYDVVFFSKWADAESVYC